MNTITVTQLYEQLTKHMGKDTSENLCSYINSKISEELEDQTKILASKEDVRTLKSDIEDLRLAMKDDINELRLATKADIAALKAEIENLRLAIKAVIHQLRLETKTEIHELRIEMNTEFTKVRLAINELSIKVSDSKAETIRWMFIFWIGQVVVTFSLLMLFIKK